jgi:hypothetical protein
MTEGDAQEMSIRHLTVALELFSGYKPRSHQGDVVREEDVMRESEDPTKGRDCPKKRFGIWGHFLIRRNSNKAALG